MSTTIILRTPENKFAAKKLSLLKPVKKAKTILFIGGGYTSIWAYKQLSTPSLLKKIRNNELKLVVICDRKHHYFHGFTGEVIGGLVPENAIQTPLKSLFSHAQLIHGSAAAISPFMNRVKYITHDMQEKEIEYDHLVVGCGTVDKEEAGCEEKNNIVYIKKPNGLSNLREQVDTLMQEHKKLQEINKHTKACQIVLLGGGFTSIEIAANLSDYIRRRFDNLVTISIVNSRDRILPGWERQSLLVKYAERILQKKGIRVYNNCKATEITAEGVRLTDGSFLKTQLIISATGQKPVAINGLKHLCLNPAEKIETDEFMNASGYANIWCGGDISLVKRPFFKTHCPSNALWAIMQGSRIGKNIRRSIKGKKPSRFYFPGLGQAAAFGTGQGALELYGIPFWGWTAYIMRMGFFFYFFPAKARFLKLCWLSFIKEREQQKEKSERFEAKFRGLVINNETKNSHLKTA